MHKKDNNKNFMKILPLLIILMLLNTTTFSQVNVTLPVIEREQGAADEFISVNVSNLLEQDGAYAFSFFLYYDKNILYLTDYKSTSISSNSLISINAETANGVFKVAFARVDPAYSGSGSLVDI